MPIYPFVVKPKGLPEEQGDIFQIHEKLTDGSKLDETETTILMGRMDSSSVPRGCASSMGWCFDFRPLLNLYWAQWYDSIIPVYAPNKKAARKHLGGKVGRIVLVEKRGKKAHE